MPRERLARAGGWSRSAQSDPVTPEEGQWPPDRTLPPSSRRCLHGHGRRPAGLRQTPTIWSQAPACSALTLALGGVSFLDGTRLFAVVRINAESEHRQLVFKGHDAANCVLRLLALCGVEDDQPVG